MPCDPEMILPSENTPAPMPSEIVTSTMSRIPSMRPKVSSASRHAVAAFSIFTCSPNSASSAPFKSKSGQRRFGANVIRCNPGSTLPGRLTPMPSIDRSVKNALNRLMQSTINLVDAAGSEVTPTLLCDSSRPFKSTTATIAILGCKSTAIATMRSFRPSSVGRRPRGVEPTALSTTHFSLINCSTICDTVLFCSPDARESSIREVGWFSRISSRTMSRLIRRAVSLEATSVSVKSICRMPAIRERNPVPAFSFATCYAMRPWALVNHTNYNIRLVGPVIRSSGAPERIRTVSPYHKVWSRPASPIILYVTFLAFGGSAMPVSISQPGVEILAPVTDSHAEILTPAAIGFIVDLHRTFNSRRKQLLAARHERQQRIDAGERPDFLPETRHIRESEWSVAPIPDDILDRRVEITGPVDRKMIINALNSGAKVFMADFEDSSTPLWTNLLDGHINLRDANRREITYTDPSSEKHYTLTGNPA